MIDKISETYTNYLDSNLREDFAQKMISLLKKNGETRSSQCLQLFFEKGKAEVRIQNVLGEDRKCYLSTSLPANASTGELWFDIVELNFMLLIDRMPKSSSSMKVWMSIEPVQIWKVNAFFNLVKWEFAHLDFLSKDTLFSKSRLSTYQESQICTNIFHEESVAYAHWFGKKVPDQFIFQSLYNNLGESLYVKLFSKNLSFWDGSELSSSEFLRIAINADNLFADILDEYDLREKNSLQDIGVYKEWETNTKISFIDVVYSDVGLLENLPRKGFEFVKLLNSAPKRFG